MSIEQELTQRLKDAMRSKDQRVLGVVRMIKSKIIEARTAKGFTGEVDDALYQQVIAAYSKSMLKAIEEYEAQGERSKEMVEQLRFEVDYLAEFLPRKLDEEKTRELVRAKIEQLGVRDPKRAGQIMGALMKEHKDALDSALTKRVVEEELR
ncbi:MAG: hypothetical protein AMXMBFR64_10720 [Myxococcales bacterium]